MGEQVGLKEGATLGLLDGTDEGRIDGGTLIVGKTDGFRSAAFTADGRHVGVLVVGFSDGLQEGNNDGITVGDNVGLLDGLTVGDRVGASDGSQEG